YNIISEVVNNAVSGNFFLKAAFIATGIDVIISTPKLISDYYHIKKNYDKEYKKQLELIYLKKFIANNEEVKKSAETAFKYNSIFINNNIDVTKGTPLDLVYEIKHLSNKTINILNSTLSERNIKNEIDKNMESSSKPISDLLGVYNLFFTASNNLNYSNPFNTDIFPKKKQVK
ncbi:MAG: hypothetical protein D4R41_01355, partial [Sediminibacterium sp.]